MQEKINRVIWMIIPVLLIGAVILSIVLKNRVNRYLEESNFQGEKAQIIVYETDSNYAKKVLAEVKEILDIYDQLFERSYQEQESVYRLNHHKGKLQLSKEMEEIVTFAMDVQTKTDGKISIMTGCIQDAWEPYFQSGTRPEKEVLDAIPNPGTFEIKNHVLISEGTSCFDFSMLQKGYVLSKIKTYLEKEKMTSYQVQIGEDVMVGNKKDGPYKVALASSKTGEIVKTIGVEQKTVVSRGAYTTKTSFQDGVDDIMMFDPKTKKPYHVVSGVTVIADDPLVSDIVASLLYQMTEEDGKEWLKTHPEIEVIWTK